MAVVFSEICFLSKLGVPDLTLQILAHQALKNLVDLDLTIVLHGIVSDRSQGQSGVKDIVRLLAVCLSENQPE